MPAISFTEINATIAQTETEVTEYEAAKTLLADKRTALVAAQDTVAGAQADVQAATDAEGSEKADVVGGLTNLVNQANAILQTLQV